MYSANTNRAKSIIDDELLRLRERLDLNVYGKKNLLKTAPNGPKKPIFESITEESPQKKSEEKTQKDAEKENNAKKRTGKRSLLAKKGAKIGEKEDEADGSFLESKRMTLRERIEFMKNVQ